MFNQTEKIESTQKHGPQGKIATLVWLKLLVSGNERWHTTDAP